MRLRIATFSMDGDTVKVSLFLFEECVTPFAEGKYGMTDVSSGGNGYELF